MNDPRKLRRIGGKVYAVQAGLDGAPLNVIVSAIEKIGNDFVAHHADIVGSNFTRGQAALKTRAASAAAALKTEVELKKIKAEKLRVSEQKARLTPVRPYEQLHLHVMHHDMMRIANFNALPRAQKAAVRHQMSVEPLMHLPLSEALLRTPADLSPISHYERAQIIVSLLQAFKADEFNSLDQQMEQLNTAEAAVRAVSELLRTATGTSGDVIENAPEMFQLIATNEPALRWLPPAPEGEEALAPQQDAVEAADV